jgi:hypothetical protein
MFKLLFGTAKTAAYVWITLLLGAWIKWDGRMLSEHVYSQFIVGQHWALKIGKNLSTEAGGVAKNLVNEVKDGRSTSSVAKTTGEMTSDVIGKEDRDQLRSLLKSVR